MAYPGVGFVSGTTFEVSCPTPDYYGKLAGPLIEGSLIIVKGEIPDGGDIFKINLESADEDVALHFNPRFSQDCIVRNTYVGGWQSEEREGGIPLEQGQKFECLIYVQDDHFMIGLNGEHFTEYEHRFPKEDITHIRIDGDVDVSKVTFIGLAGIPFVADIPDGFVQHKRSLVVSGTPLEGAERFNVNLMCDHDGHDIAFHFDARLQYSADHKVIVANNCEDGNWFGEERCHDFPFRPGHPFCLKVKFGKSAYKVAVDYEKLFRFDYRVDKECVKKLSVQGDVLLSSVKFV